MNGILNDTAVEFQLHTLLQTTHAFNLTAVSTNCQYLSRRQTEPYCAQQLLNLAFLSQLPRGIRLIDEAFEGSWRETGSH